VNAETDDTATDFSDVAEPQALLVPPRGINGYPDTLLDSIDDVMSLLSPSAWVLELVYGTLRVDPFQEISSYLTGDWKSFARCVDLWRTLAEAHRAMSMNLRRGTDLLDATWDGVAADTAVAYFQDLTSYLDSMERTLRKCSEQYEHLAFLTWNTTRGVAVLLQSLIDSAIIAAAALAAGGATAGTVVGPAAGTAVAGLEVATMLRLWYAIANLLSVLETAVLGFGGAIAQAFVHVERMPTPPPTWPVGREHLTSDWSERGRGF
jgi:hypothetical protein